MTRGNGYDQDIPLRADGLVDIDLSIWGQRVQVRPYATFLRALQDAGAEVLVVPYDWRLSNRHNARRLERRILERWFGGRAPREQRVGEEERVTLIGHSMGGLIARCFLESHPLGPVLGRRLITIGTPHRGAPVAYLYLLGRIHPFPESSFGSWAHAILVREAQAARAALGGELGARLLPGWVQTALVRFMASTFELLPNYNFVTGRGRTESYPDTYANQVHHPTGQPAMQVLRRFRSGIVHQRELADWLRIRGLEYHFLAGTGFPTVVGYDRDRDRLLTSRDGDGTVPLDSARLLPVSSGNLWVKTLFKDGNLSHQRLCQRRDVQAYCLRVLRRRRPATSGARPAGSVAKGTGRKIDVSRATRYLAVACPSQLTNEEWKKARPKRPLPPPVYNDYALMKVLYMLRLTGWNTRSRVNAFQYDQPLTPLDFSGLRDSDVIFIVGHGNEQGLYTMGPESEEGVDRLVEILTGDGNLRKRRQGKSITILLLSCRAGLGFHKGLAWRLAKRLSIDTIVGGPLGFTFGSLMTQATARSEVLIRGIPWAMEYPGSIPLKEAENETSAREGKTITYDRKRTEIERFLSKKKSLEGAMMDVVRSLHSTEVNNALDEIDARFRSKWRSLLQEQFALYGAAKRRSNLEFDMWFQPAADGYVWTDSRKITAHEAKALTTGTLVPPGPGLTSTR